MNTDIKFVSPKTLTYPCVMVSCSDDVTKEELVVLFTDRYTGTVLATYSQSQYPVGKNSSNWTRADDINHWMPCEITLSSL